MRLIHWLPLVLLAASPLQGQVPLAQRTAELERRLPAIMDSAGVPGLTLAVVENGRLVYARAFGVRSAETRVAADTATVFEAASLTKQVVAYAALRLMDRGLLDLDRPLARYLPYPDIADDSRYQRITARMILSHTSGFPNWRPRGGNLTIQFEPGARFSYSGEGFVYLGLVMEKLTGLSLPDLARREVFAPLGMVRSSLTWESRFDDNVAVPHNAAASPRPKAHPGTANAAASLHTTGPDYGRFLAALLNHRGLKAATVAAMMVPQVSVDSGVSWGLGVGLQRTARGLEFFQWGDNGGYKGYLLADPSRKSGLVYFANSDNGLALQRAILSLAGEDQPGAAWLRYEQYDSPARRVRVEMADVLRRQGAPAAIVRYHELKRAGSTAGFSEFLLNTLGYDLLQARQVKDAIAIFELNVEEYPDRPNPYDSLGEAYLADGQLEPALRNYEKSVALDPTNASGIEAARRIRERLANGEH